ncbi:MAG: hypothetical protein ACOX5R_01275 [bacterium]|jgi:hypothetical protein
MNTLEFIVQMIQAYFSLVQEAIWPLVVLILFFSLVYYVNRTINLFSRKNKAPIRWQQLEHMLNQVEQQRLPFPGNSRNAKKRQGLLNHELQQARNAIARKDEEQLMQSLYTLSMLAAHSDQELAQLEEPPTEPGYVESEIILPEEEKKSA